MCRAEVKHVTWQVYGEGRGRIAVRYEADCEFISLRNLAGKNLPAKLLHAALDAALPGWQQRAMELHQSRRNPWRVDRRVGLSGCETFLLRILKDPEYCDAPVMAHLHFTASGRIEYLGPVWMGDLLPLLEAAEAYGSLKAPEEAIVKCVQAPSMEGFIHPSKETEEEAQPPIEEVEPM